MRSLRGRTSKNADVGFYCVAFAHRIPAGFDPKEHQVYQRLYLQEMGRRAQAPTVPIRRTNSKLRVVLRAWHRQCLKIY